MCDCDDDYYIPPEPEQPKGFPGWAFARILKLLEPEYGPWDCQEVKGKSKFVMLQCIRQMFRGGKPDGIQTRITAINPIYYNPVIEA